MPRPPCIGVLSGSRIKGARESTLSMGKSTRAIPPRNPPESHKPTRTRLNHKDSEPPLARGPTCARDAWRARSPLSGSRAYLT